MRELAVEAASDTLTDSDRTDIQSEFSELTSEIDRIATTTQFNTKNLLDGSMSAASGACANVSQNVSLNATTCAATTLLTGLTDKSGNTLGINCGDVLQVSYVKDGAMCTLCVTVASSCLVGACAATACSSAGYICVSTGTISSVSTLLSADFTITSNASTGALSATAATAGSAGAVYGITVSVTSMSGEENTTAANTLSAFNQTSAATNTQCNGSATVLIGANTGQTLNLSISNMSAGSLGVENLSVESQNSADIAIKVIDTATATVSAARGKMGAEENRLEHTMNNLTTSSENITAAESRIRDVDMASEMATYTKLSVINQAATAMLAQANSQPEQVLTLLK